jgi:hypothetical protein
LLFVTVLNGQPAATNSVRIARVVPKSRSTLG